VLAPAAGRVLHVAVSGGAVLMPGETVATIATAPFTVRLQLPESQAGRLKKGDEVRLAAGGSGGRVGLVYPHVADGVVAIDLVVDGLPGDFIGERVVVAVPGPPRAALLVPADYVVRRFGLDYVRLRQADGGAVEVPVQTAAAGAGRVEILSGARDGDLLVKP
jgi:hypothetical protein